MLSIPKRNKSKDNPYTLGFNEEKNIYTIEFIDSKKNNQKVEITEKLYQVFDSFELEDISQIHKFRKHIEHSELLEGTLNKRAIHKQVSVDEQVEKLIMREKLRNAIESLPEIQKRRIKKYYFENKTFEQIGIEENCTKRAVKFSVDLALKKLLQILKK